MTIQVRLVDADGALVHEFEAQEGRVGPVGIIAHEGRFYTYSRLDGSAVTFVQSEVLHTDAKLFPSNQELRSIFLKCGGRFHGPHVETATCEEAAFYGFLKIVMGAAASRVRIRARIRAHSHKESL